MTKPLAFTRALVGFHHGAISRAALVWAAEFARRCALDLHGIFVEEAALSDAAQWGGQREFRLLAARWEDLDPAALALEARRAASFAERLLAEAAASASIHSAFEIVRASAAEALGTAAGSTDIVILHEPAGVAERLGGPYERLVRAALGSAAAVLLLPREVARRHGPVLAVASGPDDPSLAVAAAVASTVGERLLTVEAIPQQRFPAAAPLEPLPARETLIVLPRPARSEPQGTWLKLAAARRAPILLV